MKIRNDKHIIMIILLALLFFIAAEAGGNIYICHTIAEKRQYELEGIVGSIKDRYPKLSDTEIIESIQGKTGNRETGEELLSDYGFDEEYYRLNMREYRHYILLWNAVIIGISICFLGFLWIIYGRRYRSRVCEITDYLHDMRNGDYKMWADSTADSENKLHIDKDVYVEDELSLLRNEVYKTTVLLKETAEYESKLNVDLSRSMEDISHQLRTPLASITIMLDNIDDDPDMPADIRQDFLHSISMQIGWISALVNSMLKLARFDAGVIKLNDGEIDVRKLLNDCLEKLSVIIELKGVEVVVGDITSMTFNGDYNWQLEAITNIIKNAVEHSRQGGKVWITANKNNVYTQISIRDEGEGMTAEDARHIFERFYHAGNSAKESIGIGLSLSKSIVEADNGHIRVESSLNEGTEFIIRYLRKV